MNFELTDERQMLQDTLRRFLADRYTREVRNATLASDTGLSAGIWADLADLGIVGALFSEAEGGFGGAGFDIALVFEELGRAGVVEPFLDTAVLGGGLIAALGTDAQKVRLDDVIAGNTHLAFAHAEAHSRYDLDRVATTARPAGDDGVILDGQKAVVQNAEAADILIVSARDSGAVADRDGISLFAVPRGTAGLGLRGYPLTGGGRAAEVTLDGVALPGSARLGAPGAALPAIEAVVARGLVALVAEALGAMETALALTRDYLSTRSQFGRPIGSFQALQHRMADLLIELEQARSAVIFAAGHLHRDPRIRDRHASAAKHLIGRIGRQIAEEAIQMHGGIALTQDYDLAHIAKRLVMIDHRLGDTDHHLERFIALGVA